MHHEEFEQKSGCARPGLGGIVPMLASFLAIAFRRGSEILGGAAPSLPPGRPKAPPAPHLAAVALSPRKVPVARRNPAASAPNWFVDPGGPRQC